MENFFRGGTIHFEFKTRSTTSPYALTSPDTGCVIDIKGQDNEEVLSGASMTEDSTGVYSYDWTSDKDYPKGTYTARAFALNGDPVTYSPDEFQFRLI